MTDNYCCGHFHWNCFDAVIWYANVWLCSNHLDHMTQSVLKLNHFYSVTVCHLLIHRCTITSKFTKMRFPLRKFHHSFKMPFQFGHLSCSIAQNIDSIVWFDRNLLCQFFGLRWCNFILNWNLPALTQNTHLYPFWRYLYFEWFAAQPNIVRGRKTSFASSLFPQSVGFRNLILAFLFFSSRRRLCSIQINAIRHGHRILAPHQHFSFLFLRFLLFTRPLLLHFYYKKKKKYSLLLAQQNVERA